jgi:hypothetical protein
MPGRAARAHRDRRRGPAEHSLCGINAYDDTHTTDENRDRAELVRRATTAYLRSTLGIEEEPWEHRRKEATELG